MKAVSVFSYVAGSNESMIELQESSRRYFQRPDADHLSVDSNLTSLSGYGGSVEGGKISGHFRLGGWITWRSPGLELNDMGYMRQADIIQQVLWSNYRIWDPFSIFRSLNVNGSFWTGWDFTGMNIYKGGNIGTNMQFKNYWRFGTGVNRSGSYIDRSELRGGPAISGPGAVNNWLFIDSDERRKLVVEVGMSNQWEDGNYGRNKRYWLEFDWRPIPALQLTLEPSYGSSKRTIHYIDTYEYSSEDRYVAGRILSEFFSADIRINLSITPDFSIQFWGQPFLFAGDYDEFKYINNPRAEKFTDQYHVYTDEEIFYNETDNMYDVDENKDGIIDYSFDNPDFKFYEFRSNFVLRWEYIPGSTLYVVYSQGRVGDESYGEFDFNNDFKYLFDISPHNVFLIKLSYRISF